MEYIFYLGGHDAEMCEIRSILEQNNLPVYDKNLSWGASLSEFKNELEKVKNKTPVFIEIKLDIPFPNNSIIIDHHCEKAGIDKPTSIEQVAELLRIKLTHRQKLIAANDRAHIKGMIEVGASQEEIAEIRIFDRRCQGVTDKQENLAEQICTDFKSTGKLDIIEIPFKHTSPITDRLFGKYQNLLILTPEDVNFYGSGKIVLALSDKYGDGWYGGNLPKEGFWGMNRTPQNQIKDIRSFLKMLV